MRNTNEPNKANLHNANSRNVDGELTIERLLAQLRQDQLEAALAGRMAESAFYAAEAQALREESAQENTLCA